MNHAVSGGTLGPGHRCLRRTLFHCSLNVPVTAPGWKVHCLSPLVIPQVLLARHPLYATKQRFSQRPERWFEHERRAMSTDGPRHNYERRCDRIPIFAARPPDSFVFICASPASGNLRALFSTALVRDFPTESPTIQYRTSPDSRSGPDTQADVCRPDHPGPNSGLP